MANRWLKRATAAAGAVGLALVFGGGTAWAANARGAVSAFTDGTTVTWTGNGTNADGTCKNVGPSDDLNPPAGQEGWLFILSSPAGNTSALTFDFDPDAITASPVSPGVKKGNGSIHFVVYTPLGAKLVSASATNGTGQSILTVSHCENGTSDTPPPPKVSSSMTSEVHADPADTLIDDTDAKAGTAPADVHDEVTVTVSGLVGWSGTITEYFFDNNTCTGDSTDSSDPMYVDQDTAMPVDLLPETDLAAGEYSYMAVFSVDGHPELDINSNNCEPFKVVDGPAASPTPSASPTPPTTTSTPHLPVTGSSLTGILVAGVALIAAGGAALFYARRRRTTAGN